MECSIGLFGVLSPWGACKNQKAKGALLDKADTSFSKNLLLHLLKHNIDRLRYKSDLNTLTQ